MKKGRFYLFIVVPIIFMLVSACVKGKCETCTKTIGGIAGSILIEERVVCDENQIKELEESSSGTTVWSCEE